MALTHNYGQMASRGYDNDDSHYGDDSRGGGKFKWFIGIALLFILGATCTVTAFNYVYVPYEKHWNIQTELWKNAFHYVHGPKSNCDESPDSLIHRNLIGDLDKCKIEKERLESSPAYAAFKDLMQTMQPCPDFDCMYMNVSLFGYMHMIVWGVVIAVAIGVLLIGLLVVSLIVKWMRGNDELPLTKTQRALAKQVKQMQQQMQQPQFVPYTQQAPAGYPPQQQQQQHYQIDMPEKLRHRTPMYQQGGYQLEGDIKGI